VKRDDLTFAAAVTKGIKRIADMQAAVAKGVDSTDGEKTLEKLIENPAGTRQYPDKANIDYRTEINSFLGVDGNAETFYNVELKDQGIDGRVFCDATYSPLAGVISADNTKKSPCIDISDALFWEYMKIATTHKISAQGIKGLVRHRITNTDSIRVMTEIYQRMQKTETKDDLTLDAGTEEFYALVGTPNGAAAAYMLGDHPKAIGKKTIGSVMIIHGDAHSLIFKYI
jgi:hypothetical protein